jgi:hypothetical protein
VTLTKEEARALFAAGELEGVIHGTWHAYHWLGCRDAPCQAYESARKRASRQEAQRAFAAGEVDPPHGEARTATWYGCDGTACDGACQRAEAERRRKYPRY